MAYLNTYQFRKKNIDFSVLLYAVSFLAVGFVILLLFKFIKGLLPGSSALSPVSEASEKEIANNASNRLNNGDTYLNAAKWLYEEMYGNTILGWWKNSDEDLIGNYLLTIKRNEFDQLQNTYWMYKKDHGFWQIAAFKDSLLVDLKDLFSSSNQKKYLSHLL